MNSFDFKGSIKFKNYFEGWYIHILDSDKNIAYAVVFGISLYKKDPHAFIQVIDKNSDDLYYFRFDTSEFFYNNDAIKIKDNIFSMSKLIIKEGPIDINLSISGYSFLRNNIFMPGAMGCVKYLPLPTHIEIIFLDSTVTGTANGNNFNGSAYMEKNWGKHFPSKWIWMESNNFQNKNTSFVFAYANLFNNIDGFFSILKIDDEEIRLATYNKCKAKINKSDDNHIEIIINKQGLSLKMQVEYQDNYKLIAPGKNAQMARTINESLTAKLNIQVYKNRNLIYEDSATNVACENLYKIK